MRATKSTTVTVTLDGKEYDELVRLLRRLEGEIGDPRSMQDQQDQERLEQLLDGLESA